MHMSVCTMASDPIRPRIIKEPNRGVLYSIKVGEKVLVAPSMVINSF